MTYSLTKGDGLDVVYMRISLILTREMVCLVVGCGGHDRVGKPPHHGGLGSTDGGVGED